MEGCSSTRILIGTTVFFILTTVALVVVLVWREQSTVKGKPRKESTRKDVDNKERKTINEQTVTIVFPGIFKSKHQQEVLFQKYATSFYYNRTKVTDTFIARSACSFTCGNKPSNGKKKRAVSGNIYHGCCQSNVSFTAPDTIINYYGVTRTVLQYPTLKQFFNVHHCSQMEGCTGCTCSQEESVNSAVVHKTGVTEPEDIDDTEVDFFFLDGCCKCVNT